MTLPLALDPKRPYIKAAVIYYGVEEVKELRTDPNVEPLRNHQRFNALIESKKP